MQIVVLADENQRAALLGKASPKANVVWVKDEQAFLSFNEADVFVDLEFINDDRRRALLAQLLPKTVIVNSVTDTLKEINPSFVRINAWNTFLSSPLVEASGKDEEAKQKAEDAFSVFGKTLEWLPDNAGFVTARVVSMMVNEAFLALGEGVSTKEEINTAMKLGTAYPYGPFEWAEKIGVQNIVTLLQKLSQTQRRYTPSEWLVQETL